MPPPPPPFAPAGSQRWLQVAVNRVPELLDHALRAAGAIEPDETLGWRSPLEAANFTEYQDAAAFRAVGIDTFPIRPLADFWLRRGPVWDGLAITRRGAIILLEAKAHIAEVLSPPSRAGGKSRARIIAALDEARQFYAPGSTTPWFAHFYQYCNRLAHLYFVAHVNRLPARLVFLDIVNAAEMNGPTSPEAWKNTTRLIHSQLGLPESLEQFGVYHA